MMAIHPSLVSSILDYGYDEEGWPQIIHGVVGPNQSWFQWIVIHTAMGPVGICNVCAPQSSRGKKALWDRLEEVLDPAVRWVMCGDFNFIEYSDDREGDVEASQMHLSMEWKNLRDLHLRVEDPWRTVPAARSPLSLRFSRSTAPGSACMSMSRLDRFYVPIEWRDRIMMYGVVPGVVFSDHSPIILNLATTENGMVYSKNFQQFYRMNLSLLEWEDTKERIEGAWKEQAELPPSEGVADFLKAQEKTRKICRLAGKRKCAMEKKEEVAIQEELLSLQKAVEEENHTEEEEERLGEIMFRAQMKANGEAVGWARRAKIKWAREVRCLESFSFLQ